MFAGGRFVGISFTYTDGSDLIAIMEKLKVCSVLVIDPGIDGTNWDIVRKLINISNTGDVTSKQMPYLRHFLGHRFGNKDPGLRTIQDLINVVENDVKLPEVKPSDTMGLFQTSGSTGVPKLVTHTHASVMIFRTFHGTEFFSGQYKLFNSRPFNWIGGFPFGVLCGQTRVLLDGFGKPPVDGVAREIEVIQEEKCDLVMTLPPSITSFKEREVCTTILKSPSC